MQTLDSLLSMCSSELCKSVEWRTLLKLSYIGVANTSFCFQSWFYPQIIEEDRQSSSSEGSTVDGLPPGEGGESLDFEFEETMDPDACFPAGKFCFSKTYSLSFYSQPAYYILHILF